jgi:molecular chaperone DnaK (HSP70)
MTNLNSSITKQALRDLLSQQTEQFISQGREVARHAGRSSCGIEQKIKSGAYHKIPNLKQQEWETFLKEVESGEYQSDSFKRELSAVTVKRFDLIRG